MLSLTANTASHSVCIMMQVPEALVDSFFRPAREELKLTSPVRNQSKIWTVFPHCILMSLLASSDLWLPCTNIWMIWNAMKLPLASVAEPVQDSAPLTPQYGFWSNSCSIWRASPHDCCQKIHSQKQVCPLTLLTLIWHGLLKRSLMVSKEPKSNSNSCPWRQFVNRVHKAVCLHFAATSGVYADQI